MEQRKREELYDGKPARLKASFAKKRAAPKIRKSAGLKTGQYTKVATTKAGKGGSIGKLR
jgi:hypothetical protein